MTRPVLAVAALALALGSLASPAHAAAGKSVPNPWTSLDWSLMDADADGEITQKEFVAGVKKHRPAQAKAAAAIYKQIDTDHDGMVGESELSDFLDKQKGAAAHH